MESRREDWGERDHRVRPEVLRATEKKKLIKKKNLLGNLKQRDSIVKLRVCHFLTMVWRRAHRSTRVGVRRDLGS